MEQFMLQLGIMSLQACVVIGVVFCVRWIFLKAGVAGKYTCLLWFLPYLCMICPWKVEGDYGFWRQWELPTERMEVFFNEEIVPNVDEGTGIYETLAENAGAMEDLQGEAITGNIWNDVESPTQGQLTAWIVWLAGLLVILIYSADAYLKLHTKLICCRKLTDNIYLADDIDVPFVMGIRRPRIYLPSGIAKENLSYVIAHEQTHIKRQDPLKKGVAYIITGLHWFNPFAWAAFYFLSKDMETACDEETILALGLEHKQDYARVLLQISSGQKMFFGAPLAFGEGSGNGTDFDGNFYD